MRIWAAEKLSERTPSVHIEFRSAEHESPDVYDDSSIPPDPPLLNEKNIILSSSG
jgi:hypothetical protein